MTKPFFVFSRLHRANRALFGAADRRLKALEKVTTSHEVILFVLAAEDGLTSSDIALRVGMSASRLTGLIDTLVDRNFVRRKQGENDGRVQRVLLRPKGAAFVARNKSFVQNLNKRLLDNFTASEQAIIARFFDQIETIASDIESSI